MSLLVSTCYESIPGVRDSKYKGPGRIHTRTFVFTEHVNRTPLYEHVPPPPPPTPRRNIEWPYATGFHQKYPLRKDLKVRRTNLIYRFLTFAEGFIFDFRYCKNTVRTISVSKFTQYSE